MEYSADQHGQDQSDGYHTFFPVQGTPGNQGIVLLEIGHHEIHFETVKATEENKGRENETDIFLHFQITVYRKTPKSVVVDGKYRDHDKGMFQGVREIKIVRLEYRCHREINGP